jgi:hypothetical protein
MYIQCQRTKTNITFVNLVQSCESPGRRVITIITIYLKDVHRNMLLLTYILQSTTYRSVVYIPHDFKLRRPPRTHWLSYFTPVAKLPTPFLSLFTSLPTYFKVVLLTHILQSITSTSRQTSEPTSNSSLTTSKYYFAGANTLLNCHCRQLTSVLRSGMKYYYEVRYAVTAGRLDAVTAGRLHCLWTHIRHKLLTLTRLLHSTTTLEPISFSTIYAGSWQVYWPCSRVVLWSSLGKVGSPNRDV